MDAATQQIGFLRDDFAKHEQRDVERFGEVREDLKEHSAAIGKLQAQQANMAGRLTVVGGLAIVLIPVLTEIVHAWIEPHIAGK
jgi:hypothetical protein